MITLFGRKRLTEDQVAHIFVNGIQVLIDEGFESVVGLIKDSPEFVSPPKLDAESSGPFTLIVLAGNVQLIPRYFEAGQDKRIINGIISEFAQLYDIEKYELDRMVKEMGSFMKRKNHPNKNTLSAMAKAIFSRYDLNRYQQDYFKNVQAPNPVFVQRLKDALGHFIWDWDSLSEKYKVVKAG
jgi:hypothetical protein